MLDRITYTKRGDKFEKVVTQEEVRNMEGEIEALEAQVRDMKAGKTDSPEDQAAIDAAVANYEEELTKLKQDGVIR